MISCVLRRFKSFHIGIVSVYRSKGCKVVVSQLWRWLSHPGVKFGPPTCGLTQAEWQNFFPIFQLRQLLTLQPCDLQQPTVSLWKDFNLLKSKEIGFFKIAQAHSKWPYFNGAYVLRYFQLFRDLSAEIPCIVPFQFVFLRPKPAEYQLKMAKLPKDNGTENARAGAKYCT